MIRSLAVVVLAASALSASAQPSSSPVAISEAFDQAMSAIQVLQSAAAGSGVDAATAQADLARIAAAASR